jgi:hypothetical protein
MSAVTVTLIGDPAGQGRPRFTRNGVAYTPGKTRNAERLLGEWFQFSERINHFVEMLRGGTDLRRALRKLRYE